MKQKILKKDWGITMYSCVKNYLGSVCLSNEFLRARCRLRKDQLYCSVGGRLPVPTLTYLPLLSLSRRR